MKVVTVVGARPQFVKAGPVSRALRPSHQEILVHTGQHYDANMSDVFFADLDIPPPDVNLEIGSGPHGQQTGEMLARIEAVLVAEKPDWLLVYGDTNSTLAGALAASKLHIPVAHVEAGLRSFNRRMPEEVNRVVTDHVARLLFCPSAVAVENLAAEGIVDGVCIVGDVMASSLAFAASRARTRSRILTQLGLTAKDYFLATVHRAENTDSSARLGALMEAFSSLGERVVFPVHPRTRKMLAQFDIVPGPTVAMVEPLGYLDMVMAAQSARMILTDSGGIQKEAYWLGVPCITLRDETEWVETVESGWNTLTGTASESIVRAARNGHVPAARPPLYEDPEAPAKIVAGMRAAL
jgi:UDP-N-acetylglucosamine 2-epimerase